MSDGEGAQKKVKATIILSNGDWAMINIDPENPYDTFQKIVKAHLQTEQERPIAPFFLDNNLVLYFLEGYNSGDKNWMAMSVFGNAFDLFGPILVTEIDETTEMPVGISETFEDHMRMSWPEMKYDESDVPGLGSVDEDFESYEEDEDSESYDYSEESESDSDEQ